MRLFVKFLILLVVLALVLPVPPLVVVFGAVLALYVLEYWRAKNIALSAVLKEKYVNARRRVRERLDHSPSFDAESEEEALDIDDLARDVEAELEETAELEALSDTWLGKVERNRLRIARGLWRFATAPIRKLAHMLLSLTGGDKP